MADLFDNPMGLDGFEFVEFASPKPGVLEPVFDALGFSAVAKHRSKEVTLYRQGDINFIAELRAEEPRCLFRAGARAERLRHGVSRARRAQGL